MFFFNAVKGFFIKDKKRIILFVVFVLALVSTAYSILTYGRGMINSDTATLTNYVNCVNKEKSLFPKTWNYANGEIWTLGMAVLSFGQALFRFVNDESLRRMLASLFQIIIGEICIIWFSKKVFKNDSWLLICPLVTVFLWGASDLVMYQAPYSSFFIWTPIFVFLYIRLFYYKGPKNNAYAIAYFVLMTYSLMQGIRLIAEYILPVSITGIILFVLNKNDRKYENIRYKSICFMFAPVVVGTILYKWLLKWHNVNASKVNQMVVPENISDVAKGAGKTLRYFFDCFGYKGGDSVFSLYGMRDLVSIIVCLLICFIVPILQIKKLKEESEEIRFFVVYTLVHNAVIATMCVLMDFTVYYHLLSTVILLVLLSARYIYVYWMGEGEKVVNVSWVTMFVIASIISSLGLIKESDGWRDTLETRKKVSNELLAHDLHKGYATFWNAYSNEVYSDKKINFCGVDIDRERLTVDMWLVDSEKYALTDEKTFIMLTEEERNSINDRILYGYEAPEEEFIIEDVLYTQSYDEHINETYKTNLYVYVYADDYFRNIVDFFNDGVLDAREMSFNHIGVRDDKVIVMNPDGIVFGPYTAVDPGTYNVSILGSNLENCTIEIYSQMSPDNVEYKAINASDKECEYELTVRQRVEDIQFFINNAALKNNDNSEFWKIEVN